MTHSRRVLRRFCAVLSTGLLAGAPLATRGEEAAPPFEGSIVLWTKDEAAAIRRRIETEDWARTEWERMRAAQGYEATFRDLFAWAVMGDAEARERQKKDLLTFPGAKVDERPWSTHYLTALRYDVLRNQLTDAERTAIESTFRVHIAYEVERDTRAYGKANWLPNMQWPRKLSAHLMALAMRDTQAARALFACNGGFKYYLDDYISDGRFYNEEFGKQYSTVGEMLLWCRGCERLGVPELGFGYTGTPTDGHSSGGATMRRYLEGIFDLGYPRVDLGTERPQYPRVSMGDAKGSSGGFALQHAIVRGAFTNDTTGQRAWMGANMNGRDHKDRIVAKFLEPLWFELGHVRWPDGPFAYFLAQMRPPGAARYTPSLYFGCAPIDTASVRPPPAPSWLAPERGLLLLRADESPAYWEGAAPAVGLRLATRYAHDAVTALLAGDKPAVQTTKPYG